jgi:hypothetical protein
MRSAVFELAALKAEVARVKLELGAKGIAWPDTDQADPEKRAA